MAKQVQANPGPKNLQRLQGTGTNYGLRAGQSFTNGDVRYEIINVAGASKGIVRIKTASAGGTLDVFFVGPDLDIANAIASDVAYASLSGTVYATSNATQGTVTAGTEQAVTFACNGEDYAVVKFTASGTGTVTYCDVGVLSVGVR